MEQPTHVPPPTELPETGRRKFLRWAVHGLSAVLAAVVGVPAVVYLIDPRNRPSPQRGFKPAGHVHELTVNIPKEVVIRETSRDAWTLYPDNVVGRIWLVRRPGPGNQVDAFTTTCPHLGCSINYSGTRFLCPCHGGQFQLNGTRINPHDNPASRDMDSLTVRLVPIPGNTDAEIWIQFEKFKTNQSAKEVLT